MAGSGILFVQDFTTLAAGRDRRLSFILKALGECSQTHNLAREARAKLQANIDARRSLAAEREMSEFATQLGNVQHPNEAVEVPPMSWVDGSMFDLGAFDLGAFGSLDPMAFEGIGAYPYQGLAAFAANPAPIQGWMSSEPPVDFSSTPSHVYTAPMQDFGLQTYDAMGQ
jgi:hypothetical protein